MITLEDEHDEDLMTKADYQRTARINVIALVSLIVALLMNVGAAFYWGGSLTSKVTSIEENVTKTSNTLETTSAEMRAILAGQEQRLRLIENTVIELSTVHKIDDLRKERGR